MKKEKFNLIYILSCFFGGLFLIILGKILLKNETIFWLGIGLLTAALVIAPLELIKDRFN